MAAPNFVGQVNPTMAAEDFCVRGLREDILLGPHLWSNSWLAQLVATLSDLVTAHAVISPFVRSPTPSEEGHRQREGFYHLPGFIERGNNNCLDF